MITAVIKGPGKEAAYIIFRMRGNKKSAFSAPLNWNLSPEDYRMIGEYTKKKIK